MNTPLDICEARDVKGLYKKARKGSISGFTGVSQNYEVPQKPDLVVTTEGLSIRDSTNRLIELLEHESIIPKDLRRAEVLINGLVMLLRSLCELFAFFASISRRFPNLLRHPSRRKRSSPKPNHWNR